MQMIMAYVLDQTGHNVCIAHEGDSESDIKEALQLFFNVAANKSEDSMSPELERKGFLETGKAV